MQASYSALPAQTKIVAAAYSDTAALTVSLGWTNPAGVTYNFQGYMLSAASSTSRCQTYSGATSCKLGTTSLATYTTAATKCITQGMSTACIESVTLTASNGYFQHVVYSSTSTTNYAAAANAQISWAKTSAAANFGAPTSGHLDVADLTSYTCNNRRFWHTVAFNFNTRNVAVSNVHSLNCVPDIDQANPSMYAFAQDKFTPLAGENGLDRPCSC
eukprot:m.270081 g.270081  ORF g.270081 m.270081 type:complete len:216 (+) comp37959_c0_seq1:1-648(+)